MVRAADQARMRCAQLLRRRRLPLPPPATKQYLCLMHAGTLSSSVVLSESQPGDC